MILQPTLNTKSHPQEGTINFYYQIWEPWWGWVMLLIVRRSWRGASRQPRGRRCGSRLTRSSHQTLARPERLPAARALPPLARPPPTGKGRIQPGTAGSSEGRGPDPVAHRGVGVALSSPAPVARRCSWAMVAGRSGTRAFGGCPVALVGNFHPTFVGSSLRISRSWFSQLLARSTFSRASFSRLLNNLACLGEIVAFVSSWTSYAPWKPLCLWLPPPHGMAGWLELVASSNSPTWRVADANRALEQMSRCKVFLSSISWSSLIPCFCCN